MIELLSTRGLFGKPLSTSFVVKNHKHSSTFTKKRSPFILDGIFNYNEAFSAFVNSTYQKEETAAVINHFANKLKERQVAFIKPAPTRIIDIGCADSKTCIAYLRGMPHAAGFYYVGIDTNRNFLTEAKSLLSNSPFIKGYELVHGDAFSGKLKEKKVQFDSPPFDFIFASHIAYYIKDKSTYRNFLRDVVNSLSSQCGIAVFLHEDSTFYFRRTYNREKFNHSTGTPELLRQSAHGLIANFSEYRSVKFTSKLYFKPLSEELWNAAKDPNEYRKFASSPDFVATLEKLAFIVQRDLIALYREGVLSKYIDDIREAISIDDYGLELTTHMQVLVAPQCTLRNEIAKSLKDTEKQMPHIMAGVDRSVEKQIDPSIAQGLNQQFSLKP